jgi:hypothetical protein
MSDIIEAAARALEDALQLSTLVRELCEAVDNEAEDIGTGPRSSGVILREIGPTVQPIQKNIAAARSSHDPMRACRDILHSRT